MRINTKHLLFLTAVVAVLIAIGRPFYLEFFRPKNCTVTMAASSKPGVNGYTFFDANQNVRVVILEKITSKATGARGRNWEPEWLQYKKTVSGKITLRVDGSTIYFDNDIVVYYAVDGGKPERMIVPLRSISQFEFPHELWSRLIEKEIGEPSDRPESPTGRLPNR